MIASATRETRDGGLLYVIAASSMDCVGTGGVSEVEGASQKCRAPARKVESASQKSRVPARKVESASQKCRVPARNGGTSDSDVLKTQPGKSRVLKHYCTARPGCFW